MQSNEMSLKRQFASFVVPSVAAQWVFALYSMVDAVFVARGVSDTALSAVNLSSPFTTLLFSISLMFAVGTSTVVSIYMGQQDKEAANRAYSQNLAVVFAVSLVIAAAVLFNLERVADFLGATESTRAYVKQYVGTIAAFSVFFTVSYSFEVLIKTDGYPRLATIFVTSGAAANLVMDALFVLVFQWGVFGAAFATGLSQLLVVILYLTHFFGKKAGLKLVPFRFQPVTLKRVCKLGASSGVTELSAGIITFLMNHAILRFLNDDALVSFSVISYINYMVVMSMTGIAQGIQPLVSYRYGSGDKKACLGLLKYGLYTAGTAAALVFAVAWAGAGVIVGCFIPDKTTALFAYSVTAFRIYSLSFLIVGANVVLGGYFTSVEREGSSLAVSLGRGAVFLFLSLELLPRIMGGAGVWWSALLSECLCLCLTLGLWRRYKRG